MAFEFEEELLQLVSKAEVVNAKLDQEMVLYMLAAADSLATGYLFLTPESTSTAARAEAFGLQLLAKAAASEEKFTRMAAEFAATPAVGEAAAEALRRMAVSARAVAARAEEFAGFMRSVGALLTGLGLGMAARL